MFFGAKTPKIFQALFPTLVWEKSTTEKSAAETSATETRGDAQWT